MTHDTSVLPHKYLYVLRVLAPVSRGIAARSVRDAS